MMLFALCGREETEPVNPTVDPADIRGFVTTLLVSVGRLPRSRHEDACWSLHAVEGCTEPGLRTLPMHVENFSVENLFRSRCHHLGQWALRCHHHLLGDRPHEADELTGDGHDDLVGMFPACYQASVAFAQPHLRLPTDFLDGFGLCFQPELEMPTDFGGIAIGPGPFDQGSAGMGVTRFGDRTLPASLGTGILRGDQPQEFHELSGIIEACQVAEFRHRGDRDGELDPTQGLEGLDHRV
jgi:hypothetical protein